MGEAVPPEVKRVLSIVLILPEFEARYLQGAKTKRRYLALGVQHDAPLAGTMLKLRVKNVHAVRPHLF